MSQFFTAAVFYETAAVVVCFRGMFRNSSCVEGAYQYASDMRKRILVTGGAGFIGSHLCERLLADGNEVIALDNYYSGDKRNVEHLMANPLFRLVRHDVTFPYFEEVDQIYNLACPSAPADYMHDPVMTLKTSLIGAVNMLEVARRMGARILQASSGKVYGKAQVPSIPEQYRGNVYRPRTDDDIRFHDTVRGRYTFPRYCSGIVSPVGERSAYEEGKRAAESIFTAYHHQYGVDIRIPRLFNVYGPRMPFGNGRVISAFIKSALSGESISIRGNGMQTRCFLYIDDAVEALVRMMNSTGKLSEPVNIGGVDPVRIDALAEDVVHLTGSPSRIMLLNLPTDSSQNTVPDIELARRKLDWEPRIPIEEGLTRTLRYFEERMRMENRAYPFMSWVEIM